MAPRWLFLLPDPLLILREHLPVFDLLLERRTFSTSQVQRCHAAPGHLIFPRLETPLNVDFQPWDNITSLGCAVEFPLSWAEGGSTPSSCLYDLTLVPNTSASGQILLWCLLWNLHFSLHLPVYLIFVIWGLNQCLYPLIHAFQKLFICIPSQEGFPRGSIDFLIFFFNFNAWLKDSMSVQMCRETENFLLLS